MGLTRIRNRLPILFLWCLFLFLESTAIAQLSTGFRPVEKPGIRGVRIHPGALAPNRRKWFLPQNLYYEYQWRGWEYSNYARDNYERYVSILLEGTRNYNLFGDYINRGWVIYDWTETSPLRQGSGLLKGTRFSRWFDSLVISSASHGQFHTSLTIGDAIRTTLTPLTFSKPTFNGLQWDFLSDKYALTLLGSRLNAPGFTALNEAAGASTIENTTRLLGARGVAQVGDFAKLGLTWVNVSNTSSELSLGDNSMKGVLTGPQNTGNVERVIIRISDDSPESAETGASFFVDQVVIDGELHPEIVPLIRGGVRREGILEVSGADVIELIYDIRNDFSPTEQVGTFREAKELAFELVVSNDYRIEISSNLQTNNRGEQVFLPIAQARDEITDGSNQTFVRFAYGLPTGHELVGMDLELINLAHFDLRAEYVVNRRFRRFPNQNFRKLAAHKETAEAAYLTASYQRYPWFAYGEAYTMDPDYSTTAFIADPGGVIDYASETQHLFEFVDDNDDQDRFADWQRFRQSEGFGGGSSGRDTEIFPGLDENNDFISDFNQNQNGRPDYTEPFLRYQVDPPEFLFGMDMNNNTIIDRFEDDRLPDYPYERDHRGYNLYGGLKLTESSQLTLGQLREEQLSSDRESRSLYGLLTFNKSFPGLDISLFDHVKFVEDDIPENRILWVDPVGLTDFTDPLDNQDTFVNTLFLQARYSQIRNFNVSGKLKYEIYKQRGAQAGLKRDRSFFGLINKADYALRPSDRLTLWPKWKSMYQRETPTNPTDLKTNELTESLFFIGRYSILPKMSLDFGVEFSNFANLADRPVVDSPSYIEDFRSLVFSSLLTNVSSYQGYELTMNAGFLLERQFFEVETQKQSVIFVRIFAATGGV
ncbi:MAG: hypothetical protein QGH25_07430 [Candidatus Latescibacteria bacterium]|nr:hypothetical protein [Candidatus Latescibacterota bacterium]